MSKEKHEAKKSLLGELESIKDLLAEDEWGDIPILNDALPTAQQAESEIDDETDIPILNTRFEPAEPPLLTTPIASQPTTPATTQLSSSETSDIDAAVDKLNLDIDFDIDIHDDKLDAGDEADDEEADNADDPLAAERLSEDSLPSGVLPGQQSLFDKAKDAIDPSAPNQYRSHRRSEVKGRGENPFLPQHIRERLHTNKALLDIIKESPLAAASAPLTAATRLSEYSPGGSKDGTQDKPQPYATPDVKARNTPYTTDASKDRLSQMVDDIIAVYLPKIEKELRDKLMAEFQSKMPPRD